MRGRGSLRVRLPARESAAAALFSPILLRSYARTHALFSRTHKNYRLRLDTYLRFFSVDGNSEPLTEQQHAWRRKGRRCETPARLRRRVPWPESEPRTERVLAGVRLQNRARSRGHILQPKLLSRSSAKDRSTRAPGEPTLSPAKGASPPILGVNVCVPPPSLHRRGTPAQKEPTRPRNATCTAEAAQLPFPADPRRLVPLQPEPDRASGDRLLGSRSKRTPNRLLFSERGLSL